MKTTYNNINFDSELEINYYKYLIQNNKHFVYQEAYKETPIEINLGRRKTYTPDFIVYDDENKKITIIETKGYAKWSANEDNNIMDFMCHQVSENQDFLISWLRKAGLYITNYAVEYQRIKYNTTFGWVNYKFKNPNSLANKRKEKIKELELTLKELNIFKKDTLKYFKLNSIAEHKKLTEKQDAFLSSYLALIDKEIKNGTK